MIGALLLRQKVLTKSELGLSENETFIDLRRFDATRLQLISNSIADKIGEKITTSILGEQNCELSNGQTIVIPNWYLHHQGHKLEEKILETFPELNELKRDKEAALKIEILDKVIEDIPEIISKDILELFKSIQE